MQYIVGIGILICLVTFGAGYAKGGMESYRQARLEMIETLENEIASLQEQLDGIDERYESQISALQRKHASDISALERRQSTALRTLGNEQAAAISNTSQSNTSELTRLNEDRQNESNRARSASSGGQLEVRTVHGQLEEQDNTSRRRSNAPVLTTR